MDSSYLLLLCDEELFQPSPSPSPLPAQHGKSHYVSTSESPLLFSNVTGEDSNQTIQNFLEKEHNYAPEHGYAEHLQNSPDLSTARFRSIQWIISTCTQLNLAIGTAFNAANYLDRFLSMKCCMRWEGWMIELLCIACLSIASKLDEVSIPSLHDFQMEDLDHLFHPSTIQQMELVILKTLGWRLTCVTPYSYIDPLTCHMHGAYGPSTARITQLLRCALLDTKFLEYGASTIAASALRFFLQELHPLDRDAYLSVITCLIPDEQHKAKLDRCHKIMEEHIASSLWLSSWEKHADPQSPPTVIPTQRTELFDCYIDIFFGAPKAKAQA